MSEEKSTQIWYSGDWRNVAQKKPPYNGIKITASPAYDEKNKFVSVDVNFTDYSYSESGISSNIPDLNLSESRVVIPEVLSQPASTSDSTPEPNPDFTIKGEVALEIQTSGLYLSIKLAYGIKEHVREELGYILKFESTDIEDNS
jgi:hypothetical protein